MLSKSCCLGWSQLHVVCSWVNALVYYILTLQVESVYNNDRNMTYSCSYVPAQEGEHRVIIKFGEKEIHKSPFKVLVEAAAGDASKVTASGPGLEKSGVTVGKKTYFEVFTKGVYCRNSTVMLNSCFMNNIQPCDKFNS